MVGDDKKSLNTLTQMKKKLQKKGLLSLWLIFFFVSCQSAPFIPDIFMEDTRFAPLDTGASVYIFANANEARQIIELLPVEELKDSQISQALDRTNYLAAALFPQESGRRFQIVTWGNYPSSMANMAFNVNRNWQSHRSVCGQSYWHSGENMISVAVSSRQAFAAAWHSNEKSFEPFALKPGILIPEGFNEFRQGILSLWLNEPAPILLRILSGAGIPIRFPVQQLFINLEEEADGYSAVIRFQFENAPQARGMAAIIAITAGISKEHRMASILFANPPVLSDINLDIKTAILSERELSLLFEIFLLY
jgi:hypothetical protein